MVIGNCRIVYLWTFILLCFLYLPVHASSKDKVIRVLLTNNEGGYYFDQVEYQIGNSKKAIRIKDFSDETCIRIKSLGKRIILRNKKTVSGNPAYRGEIYCYLDEQGIYLVNHVPLEDYLKGVLPSEMPANYPVEALKAQAVSARTYCLKSAKKCSLEKYHADLDDTVRYQVYQNVGEEERANQAIKKTAGEILQDDNSLADVFFFSTSCGQQTNETVWNPSLCSDREQFTIQKEKEFETFILSGREDDVENEEAWYRWKYQVQNLDPYELYEKMLMQYLHNKELVHSKEYPEKQELQLSFPGDLLHIAVTNRGIGGCAKEVTVRGAHSEIVLLTENTIRTVLKNKDYPVLLQDQKLRDNLTILPSAFFVIKPQKKQNVLTGYTMIGGGFGHGIGMSQNGAKCLANEGYDYRSILKKYYPDYEIVQITKENYD